MEDFLSSENLCGQNLLRITARGSAIIAELLRLSDNIPDVFLYHPTNNNSNVKDNNEISKYLPVLFDFQYLREPDEYEKVLLETIIVHNVSCILYILFIYIVD
jgi:WASH complex subunit strumpellin